MLINFFMYNIYMAIQLTFSSSQSNQSPNAIDFTSKITPPIELGSDTKYEMALVNMTVPNTWFNISAELGNNVIRYNNGSVWRANIVIPDGQYSVDSLNNLLQAQMLLNGDYVTSDPVSYDITIYGDNNTLKVVVQIANGYQLDLSLSSIYKLLGFDSGIISTTTMAPHAADLSNGITSFILHSDLITSTYINGGAGDILYVFNFSVGAGFFQTFEPNQLIFIPIRSQSLLELMRFYITDQLNRYVNFNGEDMTVTVYIRPIK